MGKLGTFENGFRTVRNLQNYTLASLHSSRLREKGFHSISRAGTNVHLHLSCLTENISSFRGDFYFCHVRANPNPNPENREQNRTGRPRESLALTESAESYRDSVCKSLRWVNNVIHGWSWTDIEIGATILRQEDSLRAHEIGMRTRSIFCAGLNFPSESIR
jgi:hypothetical protein